MSLWGRNLPAVSTLSIPHLLLLSPQSWAAGGTQSHGVFPCFSLSLWVTPQGAPGIRGPGATQPFLRESGSCGCPLEVSAVRESACDPQVMLQQTWRLSERGVTRSLAASLTARWFYRITTTSSDLGAGFQDVWILKALSLQLCSGTGSLHGHRSLTAGWCPTARCLRTSLSSNTLERIIPPSRSSENLLAFRNTLWAPFS